MLNELLDNGYLNLKGVVSRQKMESIHQILEELFSMPVSEKLKYKHDRPTDPGYTPYGSSKAWDTGVPNLLEAWDASHITSYKWPESMSSSWPIVADIQNTFFDIAQQILSELENELGLENNELRSLLCRESSSSTFLHYPKELTANGSLARRQSLHTDMSLLTINPYASSKGLIVEYKGKRTIADPDKEDLAILPGRIMEFVTGGYIKACLHTVETPENINNSSKRISLPFFAVPNSDTTLSVIESVKLESFNSGTVKMRDLNDEYFRRIFDNDFSPN